MLDERNTKGTRLISSERVELREELVRLVSLKVKENVHVERRHPQLLRMAVMDAATYRLGAPERVGGATGGSNGSIMLDGDEKNEMSEAGMGETVVQLERAKAEVDRAWKDLAREKGALQVPDDISWADMLALSAQFAVVDAWERRGGTDENPGEGVRMFSRRQGRNDTGVPDPERRLPPWVLHPMPAYASDARTWFRETGFTDAQAAAMLLELCGGVDEGTEMLQGDAALAKASRNFQKDQSAYRKAFQEAFIRMTSLGSSFEPYAYLYDLH